MGAVSLFRLKINEGRRQQRLYGSRLGFASRMITFVVSCSTSASLNDQIIKPTVDVILKYKRHKVARVRSVK